MDKLEELIAKVEALTGPNYEVERLITEVTGYPNIYRQADGSIPAEATFPNFTASLDAAIALTERVLPGWFWLKPMWNEMSVYRPGDGDCEAVEFASDHSIPAIAIILATLRALAASGGRNA